jgi:EAL domain-containing protein (putative c-di-GMP-specific phosphodiesterase class I)
VTEVAKPRGRMHVIPTPDRVEVVLQPIIDISTGLIVAAEALARFPDSGGSTIETALFDAYRNGVGADLEAVCVRAGLARRAELPSDVLLSVNVSPNAAVHPAVLSELNGDLRGVIVEITEQPGHDAKLLFEALAELRRRGALIAIDDVSTGYAGLLRLATLKPDIVKLDRGLVTAARGSEAKIAVVESLVSLSRRIGARVLGEGVETLDDLTHLAALGVDYAQGWAIAPPAAELPDVAAEAVRACRGARALVLLGASLGLPRGSVIEIGAITAALAGSAVLSDVHLALARAAEGLGIDAIGLSAVVECSLQEVSSVGAPVNAQSYPLREYPATLEAIESAMMLEAHVSDPNSDEAERRLLAAADMASLLLTPVVGGGTPLGVLEFRHRTHRRWTTDEMNHARTLAEHVANVLMRLRAMDAPGPLEDRSARPHSGECGRADT